MSGVLTVARLELTVRVRAGRWRWLLGGWFIVLVGFTALLNLALSNAHDLDGDRGTVMYGGLQLFLLALAMLVMPALTSQSVNGDRERGTLGVLQVTRLSAFDIAAGKLLAAWGTACVFLLASAPMVAWSMADGGVPVVRVVIVTLVVALLLGVICAISLGFSALLSRGTTSSVLSYLSVFALTLGTLIVFGLATAATIQTRVVHFTPPPGAPSSCCTEDQSVDRTDLTWWLLAPNPFVVLADAAPVVAERPSQGCGPGGRWLLRRPATRGRRSSRRHQSSRPVATGTAGLRDRTGEHRASSGGAAASSGPTGSASTWRWVRSCSGWPRVGCEPRVGSCPVASGWPDRRPDPAPIFVTLATLTTPVRDCHAFATTAPLVGGRDRVQDEGCGGVSPPRRSPSPVVRRRARQRTSDGGDVAPR